MSIGPQATDALIADLRARFSPPAAEGITAVIQYCIAGEAALHYRIAAGGFEPAAGPHADPTLTIDFADVATARAAARGELDVVASFLAERVRADGHLVLAMRALMFLFAPQVADGRAQLT